MQSEIEQISTRVSLKYGYPQLADLNQMALIHKHKKVQLQIKYLLQNKIS